MGAVVCVRGLCNVIMGPRNMIIGPWNVNRGTWNLTMERGMRKGDSAI